METQRPAVAVLPLVPLSARVGYRVKAKLIRADSTFVGAGVQLGPLVVTYALRPGQQHVFTVAFREAVSLEYFSIACTFELPGGSFYFPGLRSPAAYSSVARENLTRRPKGILGSFLKPEERLPFYSRQERVAKGFGSFVFARPEGDLAVYTAQANRPFTLLLEAEAPNTLYLQPDVAGVHFNAGESFELRFGEHLPLRLPQAPVAGEVGVALWPPSWQPQQLVEAAREKLAAYSAFGIKPDFLSLEAPFRPDDLFEAPDAEANPAMVASLAALRQFAAEAGTRLQLFAEPFYLTAKSNLAFRNRKEVLLSTSGKALEVGSPAAFLLNISNPAHAQLAARTLQTLAPFAHQTVVVGTGAYLQAAYNGHTPEMVARSVLAFVNHHSNVTPSFFCDYPAHWGSYYVLPTRLAPPRSPKWVNSRKAVLAKEGEALVANAWIESLLLGFAAKSPLRQQSPPISLVAEEKTGLPTEDERYAFLLANVLACTHLVLQDSPGALPLPAAQTLQALLPHRVPERITVRADTPFYELRVRVRGLDYIALFNLGEVSYHYPLPSDYPFYYNGLEDDWLTPGSNLTISGHDALLLLCVEPPSNKPTFAGSTVHFLPGQEIETLSFPDFDEAEVRLHPNSLKQGSIWLALPNGHPGLRVNGLFARPKQRGGLSLILVDARNCPLAPLG